MGRGVVQHELHLGDASGGDTLAGQPQLLLGNIDP
jgi:hypothetical protein